MTITERLLSSQFADRGRPRDAISLPDGARICFTVDLGFEAFTQACQYRLRPVAPGQADPYSLSFAEYGLRVGIWRLLDIAAEMKLTTGVSINGLAAERYPQTLKAVASSGHEMIAHGWTNDPGVASDDLETERQEIDRTVRAIEAATGATPVGWMSPGYAGSPARLEALSERGFLYSCDDAADDLPYVVEVAGRPHVIMPRTSFGSNDLTNWFAPRHPPSAWLSAFKSQFDALYAEALAGRPGWMELFLHSQFAGRAQAALEVKEMIRYARSHPGVWSPTRREFAAWILEHPAYHG